MIKIAARMVNLITNGAINAPDPSPTPRKRHCIESLFMFMADGQCDFYYKRCYQRPDSPSGATNAQNFPGWILIWREDYGHFFQLVYQTYIVLI